MFVSFFLLFRKALVAILSDFEYAAHGTIFNFLVLLNDRDHRTIISYIIYVTRARRAPESGEAQAERFMATSRETPVHSQYVPPHGDHLF